MMKQLNEQQIYTTVVERKLIRCRVHAGEQVQMEETLRVEFAKEMAQKYPEKFLRDLLNVSLCPINNKAVDLLNPLREHLEGCFDEDALQLFECAVDFAYEGKILTSAEYYFNKAWLKRELDFLVEKNRIRSIFRKELSGFTYKINGKKKLYSNALIEKTSERRIELMRKGIAVTPIYKKEYFFNDFSEFPEYMKAFDAHLLEKMDDNYWRLIEQLYAIKSEVSPEAFHALEASVQEADLPLKNTVAYYKTLWHMRDIENEK